MNDEGDFIITKKVFPANSRLCIQGEICPYIFFLLHGTINVELNGKIIRVIDKKGSFIGELSPLLSHPSSTNLIAAQESECIVVPIGYLEELIVKNPEEGVNLLGTMASRLIRNTAFFPGSELSDMDLSALNDDQEKAAQNESVSQDKKIILISGEDQYKEFLSFHFNPLGFEVDYTNDPRSIIENLDTLDPDMIIYDYTSFPRHWKPLLKLLRDRKGVEEALFILAVDENFAFEEAAKAAYLKINGIISSNLKDRKVLFQLNDLIRRYKSLVDKRKFNRIVPKYFEQFRLLFTHPLQNHLVSGTILDISLAGSNFEPQDPALTSDLEVNQHISGCSLRIGEDIITVNCRIVRNKREIGLEFESFENDGHQELFKYLMERPERDMKDFIEKAP